MNRKLELDFSELLLACVNDNPQRIGRILFRLDNDQKEKLVRSLVHALSSTLYTLPTNIYEDLKEEFGFEIKSKEAK
jgi:hypothetical protein